MERETIYLLDIYIHIEKNMLKSYLKLQQKNNFHTYLIRMMNPSG